DQKPLAATGRELLDRLRDAFGAAGKRNDGLGAAIGGRLFAHKPSVPDKSSHHGKHAERDAKSGKPPDAHAAPGGVGGVGSISSSAGHRFANPRSGEI